jgi:hypothetical protein
MQPSRDFAQAHPDSTYADQQKAGQSLAQFFGAQRYGLLWMEAIAIGKNRFNPLSLAPRPARKLRGERCCEASLALRKTGGETLQ